jgi:hypothetical protein
MSEKDRPDELQLAVRHALETTRALAACPFHPDVLVRVGDDAAETDAFLRAKNARRSDGKPWKTEALRSMLKKQLAGAADYHCPLCANTKNP